MLISSCTHPLHDERVFLFLLSSIQTTFEKLEFLKRQCLSVTSPRTLDVIKCQMEIGFHKNIQIYLNQWLWYKQNGHSCSNRKLRSLKVLTTLFLLVLFKWQSMQVFMGEKMPPGNIESKYQQANLYKPLRLMIRATV